MPAEVFRLIVDNSGLVSGLKDSEAKAAASTGAIVASLQKIEGGGAVGAKGIHLVNDSLKLTRAEIRESNGSIAMLGEMLGIHIPRHARGMLSSLQLIGPAMNAAFNSVAVIAVGMAIFEAGKKAFEFFQKSSEAAEKTKAANEELAAALNKTNLEEAVAIDKVEKHIAVLEKKPYNGLKASLDEAALSAVNLAQKLDADIQKARALLQSQDAGFLGQNLQGKSGTESSQSHLNAYNIGQNNIDVDFQNQLDHARQIGATKAEIDALEQRHLQAKANYTLATYNTVKEELDARKEMAALFNQSYQQRLQAGTNGRLAALQARFGTSSESTSAMEDMLGSIGMMGHRQQLDATMQGDKVTEANDEEHNRMAGVAKTAQEAADKAQRAWEKTAFLMQKPGTFQKKIAEHWESGPAPEGDPAAGLEQAQFDNFMHRGEAWENYNRELARSSEITGGMSRELSLVNIQFDLSHGKITAHSAALQEAAIHADMYTAKIDELKAELKAITNVDPLLQDPRNATAAQRIRNQIATVTGEQKLSAARDANATDPNPTAWTTDSLKNTLSDSLTARKQDDLNLPNQIKQLQDQFLTGMNTNIGALILGEKTNWATFLKQLASTLVGDGLKQIEGALFSMAHFADGGYTGTDPVLVGERGPEIASFSRGAFITPNSKINGSGGGAFYYIDAKEGDTATLNRNMMRGLMAIHGQAVADAGAVEAEKKARMPRGSW